MAELSYGIDDVKIGHVRDIFGECAAVTDPDRCEFAFKATECGIKAAESRGIDFKDLI